MYRRESGVSQLELFRGEIELVDLDYDLGTPGKTGYDVLKYMKEHGIDARYINLHSSHPEGLRAMEKYAEENFPASIVTRPGAEIS